MNTTPAVFDTDSAVLMERVVTTFAAGLSAQNRLDAQNAFQFAALAAGAEFDRKTQREQWFDRLVEVLRTCGWAVQQRAYERESSSSTSVTVGAVALRVFGAVGRAALGGPIGTVLGELAEKAFEGLSAMTQDVEVFLADRKDKSHGLTGVAGCVEVDGLMYMVVSAVDYKAPDNATDVLGINVRLSSSDYYKGTAVLLFNQSLYARAREHVLGELGDHTETGVLKIKLAKR